jgi:beta-fructofuranosidase
MKLQNLEQSRAYEKEYLLKIRKESRPTFHFSSPIGWLNDPNGFSMYKGECHLFYQYHPFSMHWGPMHWGHATTNDFVKWSNLPIALAPDQEYDSAGCFSGSAIEKDGKHILAYTSVVDEELENQERRIRQQQCIAIGDGRNYEKLASNPVISEHILPDGVSKVDFRDPKIWFADDMYYMLVANRSEDGSGQLLLFMAKELDKWDFVSVFDKCDNVYGKMWECPDYFMLGSKEIIMMSPQDMRADGLQFHSGNGTIYFVGYSENGRYLREQVGVIDYGLDFYAPQTLLTKDNRRIMIAWMQSWDIYLAKEENGWSGMMTLPREITYCENQHCIIQTPVKEIEAYWIDTVIHNQVTVTKDVMMGIM